MWAENDYEEVGKMKKVARVRSDCSGLDAPIGSGS